MAEIISVRPHAGPQERALASSADVVIYGGARGGGKTWALLMEPVRHHQNAQFSAVIFRRTSPQITNPGGLWDEATKLYPLVGARPRTGSMEWIFPSGMRVKFSHMEYEQDTLSWLGAQVPFIGFDQVETFLESQFWFMFSSNRSLCGVRPYIRATCNPVPEDDPVGGWLHRLIQWWIDKETGLPIYARGGQVRWFVRINDELHWGDDPIALVAKYPETLPLSLTFIPAKLDDNPTLVQGNPGYRANLMALPLIERERHLGGNWNVRPEAGKVFNRSWFEIVDAAPIEVQRVRAWDKAGTQGDGDWSAGVRIAKAGNGFYYVEEVTRGQWGSMARNAVIRQTAAMDGVEVEVALEQEPGSGGKESAEISIRELAGYIVHAHTASGPKLVRAGPLSAQAEAGNVKLVRGPWNKDFIDELHGFTGAGGGQDDQVDAAANAFNRLALRPGPMQMWGGGVQPKDPFEGTEKATPTEHDPAILEAIAQTGFYWPGR